MENLSELLEQLRLPGEAQFRAFVDHHQLGTVQNIASVFGVSYETVRLWKSKPGAWDGTSKSVKLLLWLCIQADRSEDGRIDPLELLKAQAGALDPKK